MKNIVINLEQGSINPPVGSTHVGTSWQVSTVKSFTSQRFLILDVMNDMVDLVSKTVNTNVLDDTEVYFRYKLHFNNGTSTGWSGINTILIEGTEKPTIIRTPEISTELKYVDELTGELVVKTSDFKIYGGTDSHVSTTYKIKDDLGNEIVNVENDTVNLKEIKIPVSTLNDNRIYSINAQHNTSTKSSDVGVSNLSTFIENGKFVNMELIGKLYAYANLSFDMKIKTTKFKKIIIRILEDDTNVVVVPDVEQQTLFPMIETLYLDLNKTYRIEAQVRLQDNSRSTTQTIFVGTPAVLMLYTIDPSFKYSGQYTYIGDYNSGGISVQSVRQLLDGSILLSKQSSSKVMRYELVDGVLTLQGEAFDLQDTIGVPYINIQQLYNGKVLVNYSSNSNSLTKQRSVFKLYKYNQTSKVFTLENSITMEDHWTSTAISNSMFINKDSSVYYVPGAEVVEGENVELSLYKLDTETFESTKVAVLPFGADRHVSLVTLSNTKFLVLGGTLGSQIVNKERTWTRSNNDIYTFDTVEGNFVLQSTLGSDVSADIYNFQGYLRKDGKVVLFNSVRNGTQTGNQDTIVYNPNNKTYQIDSNDFADGLLYRSTISLLSGDMLRMTALPGNNQYVYNYIGDRSSVGEIVEHEGTVEEPNELVVSKGETLNLENLDYYTKITILGDSLEDTGSIIHEHDGTSTTYNYTHMIITRDTVMDRTTYEDIAPEQVVIIGNVNFTIEDY